MQNRLCYITAVWLYHTNIIFGKFTIADIELLLACSTNEERQIVILRNWTELWSAVCALCNCCVMCMYPLSQHTYVCMYVCVKTWVNI